MERTTKPRPAQPQDNHIVFHRNHDEPPFSEEMTDLISRGYVRFVMRMDRKPGWILTDAGRAALTNEQ